MRSVTLPDLVEQMEFAKRAALEFLQDPGIRTYTDAGDVSPGCWFAVK